MHIRSTTRLRTRELTGYLRVVTRERLVGTNVAGYTMAALVGEGGTSTVYRAEHPQYGTAAVKVLREKLRQDKTAVERFLREARYGARVIHPNVVRTIEIGMAEASDGGAPLHFLAIEWASGDLLERYAKRNAPLPASVVADIIVQIAGAVQAAHAAGIVHRDLKPENVMYDPETHRVKLLDFGIATDTDPATDERVCAVITAAGAVPPTLTEVRDYLLDAGMSDWCWPERLEVLDDMPRTPMGKIRKADLRKRYAGR